MEEKGVSSVIAVVLMISLSIVVVLIVWALVSSDISIEDGDSDSLKLSVGVSDGYTFYDYDKNVACVQVERGNDKSELTEASIIFEVDGNSCSRVISVPRLNEARVFCFDMEELEGVPDGVSVVSKKSSSSVDFSSGTYSSGVLLGVTPFYDAVAYWKLDGNADDEKGKSDGVIEGAGIDCDYDGVDGSACHFSKKGDRIRIFHNSAHEVSDKATFAFWAKVENHEKVAFVSKRDSCCSHNNSWAMGIDFSYPPYNDDISFEWATKENKDVGEIPVSFNHAYEYPREIIELNKWVHLVFVFDSADIERNVRMYVNSDEVEPLAGGTGHGGIDVSVPINLPMYTSESDIYIGAVNNGSSFSPLDGAIDEFAIWDKAMTSPEVKELYKYY